MKKILINFLILFLLIAPVLFACSYIVDKGLRKSRMDMYFQWTDIYSSNINADVLLCGSSRTYSQLSPKVIDSILGVNSYNIGMNGWTFSMQYARFKVYMQHNRKPAYVVQGLDVATFVKSTQLFEYEQFFPYINDTILLNASDKCIGRFTSRERFVPMFKYNNHMSLVAEGFNCYFNTGRQFVSHKYKGFENKHLAWNGVFDEVKRHNPQALTTIMADTAIAEFDEYLTYCKSNNIKVILEFAPVYYEGIALENNWKPIKETFKKFAEKYDLLYLDYSDDSMCYDKKYFHDSQHLNSYGSQVFSVKLANDIKRMIDSGKVHYNKQQ